MSKQIINIGQSANDKSGDPLRTAFTKVNENFTELYNVLGTSGGYDRLTNGIHTIILNGDGNLIVEEFARIKGTNDLSLESYSESELTRSGLFLNGNPTLGNAILFATTNVVISSDNDRTPKDWNFDTKGTLTTPLLLPLTFTAVLDEDHMVTPVALTDAPWEFVVEFQVNPDSTVQTMIGNNTPWFTNPGYVDGYTFEYTEADHGIPGYTFTLGLQDVVQAGPAGWTTNLAASIPPEYPSTISSLGAIKLTADTNSFVFGTDGKLTLPTGGDIVDSNGASVIGAPTVIDGGNASTTF